MVCISWNNKKCFGAASVHLFGIYSSHQNLFMCATQESLIISIQSIRPIFLFLSVRSLSSNILLNSLSANTLIVWCLISMALQVLFDTYFCIT